MQRPGLLPHSSARTEREIVLESVRQEWQAFVYAAVELRADSSLVSDVICFAERWM